MSFTYTFQESDAGKTFRLTASLKSNPSITDSILINCKESETPAPSGTEGSFPRGTSSESFCLICKTDEDYINTLDANTLNEYAYRYLENVKEEGEIIDKTVTYYSRDSKGIYIYINKFSKNGTDYYDNEIVQINGQDCYKVYIAGYADIIAYHKDESIVGKYSLQLSNGFYNAIANKLYLFIAKGARLINLVKNNDVASGFYYHGESLGDTKYFHSNDDYENNSYYLSIGSSCTINDIKTPLTDTESISYLFKDNDINVIITSDTMTDLEYFADIVNAERLVLSTNVKKIGDFCFYGSSISGTIELETEVLEEIGDYAFANMVNLNLLNINASEDGYSKLPLSLKRIGNYAFQNSAGLNKINLTNCRNLTTIGNQAFGNCGNLRYVQYLESQVESDNISETRLLYLPPDVGANGKYAPKTANTEDIEVTATYQYQYPYVSEESKNSLKTFLGCTNVHWLCR